MGRTTFPNDRLDDAAAPSATAGGTATPSRGRHRLADTGPVGPSARHRLAVPDRAVPDPADRPSRRHRLADPADVAEPADRPARRHRLAEPPHRRRRANLAPVLVGLVVLGLLAGVAALRPAPGPAPTDAALTGAASAATSTAPAPAPNPVPTPAPTPSGPTAAAGPTTASARPSASRPAPRSSSPTAAARRSAAPGPRAGAAANGAATNGAGTNGAAANTAAAPAGTRAVRPSCRGDADAPRPGDVICFTANLGAPLKISTGGTPGAPIVYSGDGRTRVPGITATADNVVIQGFVSDGADSTGIWASGRNVVVQDNEITRVRHTDEDLDAIRFFGDGAKILHNSVHDLEANDVGGSHVDCIQTFATSRPGSSNVTIKGNRCEGIRAQCLMAEGPNAETASGKGGGGRGVSRDWVFDANFCDSHAEAQSVALQDVQNVTLSNNVMAGKGNKAFALGQNSTGAVVRGNTVGAGYGREVGFDDDSARAGYQGPPAR